MNYNFISREDNSSGADFMKGLSPVSGSNLRLLSQIIVIFFLSPKAQPLWISQKVSVSALAEPLAQMLRLVDSRLKFCKNRGSNMAVIILFPLQNLKCLKIRYKCIKQPPEVVFGQFYMFTRFLIAK